MLNAKKKNTSGGERLDSIFVNIKSFLKTFRKSLDEKIICKCFAQRKCEGSNRSNDVKTQVFFYWFTQLKLRLILL